MAKSLARKGEVVLVTFPFTDLSGEKRRPSLVVGASGEHVVVAFITTRGTGRREWLVPLPATKQTGLMAPSTIRCDKILSVDAGLIPGSIGTVPSATARQVDSKLRKLLAL